MSDITEKLLTLIEETELPKKGRGFILDAVKEIKHLRGDSSLAEAEICRLREGLRRIRHDFTDVESVGMYIDKLLKAEYSKEF